MKAILHTVFLVLLSVRSAAEPASETKRNPTSNNSQALVGQVQKIFKTNCYQCHGQPGQKVRGGFGYVLDFEKLRTNPDYLNLKNPEQSELFQRIEKDEMPPGKDVKKISSDEKRIILDWIKAGAPSPESTTNASKAELTAAYSYIVNAIAEDLKAIPQFTRSDIRYLSIAHMPTAGDSKEDLDIFRDGLAKLVNSLSDQEKLFPLQAVDDQQLIFRINLKALNWPATLWDTLAATSPYTLTAPDEITYRVNEQTNTLFPVIRGDWFAFAASKPPFYHLFLKIPETDTALERDIIGIDVDVNISLNRVLRAGFSDSGVSQNNRMIERHKTKFGAYWKSYDFKDGSNNSDLFLHPTGPGTDSEHFQHAGGEIIYNLPNGLQAYMLVDADHRRLDEAPIQIVQDTSRRNSTIVNGISCMSCHSSGMRTHSDQIRDYVEKHQTLFSSNILREVLDTYLGNDELTKAFTEDQNRFVTALANAGLKNLKGDIEPIRYLTDRFEKDVDLKRAAAELGIDLTTLQDKASKNLQLSALVSRMTGRGMPRPVFVDVYREMVNLTSDYAEPKISPAALGMNFASLPPGTFTMGSPNGELDRVADGGRPSEGASEKEHSVTISRGFEMQTTTVTQLQWFQVMGQNPSSFKIKTACPATFIQRISPNGQVVDLCPNMPVETVSWNDICGKTLICGETDGFIKRINEAFQDGYQYRLPTEAEWEYAARAKTTTARYFGDDKRTLLQSAWFSENSNNQPHDVAEPSHPANPFGLFDMLGNVRQWVSDLYEPDYGVPSQRPATNGLDPQGPPTGVFRISRGGSWMDNAAFIRAAHRKVSLPESKGAAFGFRLVRIQ